MKQHVSNSILTALSLSRKLDCILLPLKRLSFASNKFLAPALIVCRNEFVDKAAVLWLPQSETAQALRGWCFKQRLEVQNLA